MSDLAPEKKGFLRLSSELFFYGCTKRTVAWATSILSASAGLVFSAGALIALTLAILNGPAQSPIYKQYHFPLSHAELFYVFSVAGIASYLLTFKIDSHFSSIAQDYGQISNLDSKKSNRRRVLVRILACRIKYLVAPYLFVFLGAVGLALVQKQFFVILLALSMGVLVTFQDTSRVSKFASIVFSDRAMTPLKLALSRLVAVALMGGLLLSFRSYFNFSSLLVIMSFLVLAVQLIRCWNLYNKV